MKLLVGLVWWVVSEHVAFAVVGVVAIAVVVGLAVFLPDPQ